jgi:hypothetical protein
LETRTHGFELEVRGGDIPIDYNSGLQHWRKLRKRGQTILKVKAVYWNIVRTAAMAKTSIGPGL